MALNLETPALRARALILAILTAVLAMLMGAGTASAISLPAAETRVGVISPTATTVVGVAEHTVAGQHRVRAPSQRYSTSGHCVAAEGRGALGPNDLIGRTSQEIRDLAALLGLAAFGQADAQGNYRKFKDPVTGQQRVRIDSGHVAPQTGLPFNDPKAAVPHVHGYDQEGNKIRNPLDNNPHFPLC